MSNISNNMQTQTSNTLHNAIMEAGSKDRPPMLAPGNYIQWKSRIKRYIDTKHNHELIHYCLENPPYGATTSTERVFETYKNVTQEIRDQLNAEAEAIQIILTGIDNDIYSTVDACPNACEKWIAIERLKQGESINVQDLETNLFWEFGKFTSLDDSEASSSFADDKISERIEKANQQNKDFKNQNKDLQDKYDVLKNQATTFEMKNKELNEQLKVLIEKNDDLLAQMKVLKDQLQVKHVLIDTHVECQEKYAKLEAERYEYMIRYSAYFDNDKQHRKQIADQEVLYDKMSVQLVELDKHVRDLKITILEKDIKISEECVRNKDLEKEKCLERLNVYENKLHNMDPTNQTVHMIMPSKDTLCNGRKGIGFENPSYFEKAKDLTPSLYNEKVIGLGYTLMFLTHSDEALEIEKFKRVRENKIEFAYKSGSLNASYVNEKIYFLDDYFQEIINPDFDKIDSPFQQTSSLKPYVPTVILEKIIIDLEDEVVSLFEKQKVNSETIKSLKSKGFESSENAFSESENQSENNCKVVEKDVRRPKHSSVIWKKKGLSNTSNADLSSVSHLKLDKDVKRYSRKDLLSCNNSHLEETSSAYVCNDAMNVSCNSSLCNLFDENNLFIIDDESVRISSVSKMPFRKKPRDSLNIVQICLWIINLGCSKHMTGNHALLTNFVEKFIGTVRFGNNDFAVIAGYGDVLIGSMTIKKLYYVEGLGHNLFSASSSQSWLWHQRLSHLNFATINNLVKNNLVQDEASEVIISFIKKTQVNLQLQVQRVRTDNENAVVERRNRTLVEAARTMLTFANLPLFLWDEAIAIACFTQNRSIIHKNFDKTPYELMNKRKPNIKFFRVFGCRCYLLNDYEDLGKLKEKRDIRVFVGYSKESDAFRIYNKRTQVGVPSSNTQSVSYNMVPNGDEASTSHNVFNKRLEDAYFDASTSFHDPSNVHTFYQPYSHEKNWTKDHPLHKIIGDPKSSVRTRGQLANSCLFSCLLSSIEPANVAEALRDADWTSNALHNAIMEAGSKDRPPMLAPGNYVQWKSKIKRYIDTKPNHEPIYYCLKNPPYKYKWADKKVPVTKGIDNNIYSTVDACPNAYEMWKAIERSQQAATRNKGKAIVNSPPLIYDQEPSMVAKDDEMSKDKEIDKLMALISLSFKKIYKPTNNNLRTSSNTSRENQDNSLKINKGTGYDTQRIVNVAGAKENVGTSVVRSLRFSAIIDDTDDESEDHELEAHYMYMEKLQEVTPDVTDNFGPIIATEPLQQ
nr:hypothetical protein [Tanacetum cinerariifolium]